MSSKTYDDVLQRLRAAAARVVAEPDILQVVSEGGSPIEYLDVPEFQTHPDSDSAA